MADDAWRRRVEELRRHGRNGYLPPLRAALADPRLEVRRVALRELANRAPQDLPELLWAATSDSSSAVRRVACELIRSHPEQCQDLLQAALDGPQSALAAALLAGNPDGRKLLAARPQQGLAWLLAAAALPDLAVRLRLGLVKALVIVRGDAAGDCLAALAGHPSPLLRQAAGRALWCRWDRRALPWVLARLENDFTPDRAMVAWVGEQGEPNALPVLKSLLRPWRWLRVGGEVRQVIKAAVARLENDVKHIPLAALSRASEAAPDARALSLWLEPEQPSEAQAEG
ncbi:MAG: hypothetical protein IT204_12870 [Fimbriimonadaceae bacterium]|nr:hypothetical protein [Fimbriimonadaceae bacterium]